MSLCHRNNKVSLLSCCLSRFHHSIIFFLMHFVIFSFVFYSVTTLSYCLSVLWILVLWWLYSSWHCVLPLHFHFIQTFMVRQLSKVVHVFNEFTICLGSVPFWYFVHKVFSANIGVTSHFASSWWLCAWSLSPLFWNLSPCGLLFHTWE